jgi:hypothetical protein
MLLPCFLQNSSNARSVTNVSASLSCPTEISFCTSPTSRLKILAARFQEYGPSGKLRTAVLSDDEEGSTGEFLAQKLAREARVIRGSRIRNTPPATSCRKRVRLIRNNFRNARCDHPSVTLALIPSAPRRKRTARSERPNWLGKRNANGRPR